jgi:hypothetical protein
VYPRPTRPLYKTTASRLMPTAGVVVLQARTECTRLPAARGQPMTHRPR